MTSEQITLKVAIHIIQHKKLKNNKQEIFLEQLLVVFSIFFRFLPGEESSKHHNSNIILMLCYC